MRYNCFFALLMHLILCSFARKLPDFIETCKRNDPALSECYKKSFNDVIRLLTEPRNDLNLRQIEPLHIEKIDLSFGNGSSLAFDANLENLELLGFLEMKCINASIDIENLIYKVETYTPMLTMKSNYKAKGKVLLIQFDSSGKFTGELGGVLGHVVARGDSYTKNGKTYYSWGDHEVRVDIKSIKMYFDSLLARKDLNEGLNRAINENIKDLYDELRPVVNSVIKAILEEQANNFYKQFPADELFPL